MISADLARLETSTYLRIVTQGNPKDLHLSDFMINEMLKMRLMIWMVVREMVASCEFPLHKNLVQQIQQKDIREGEVMEEEGIEEDHHQEEDDLTAGHQVDPPTDDIVPDRMTGEDPDHEVDLDNQDD